MIDFGARSCQYYPMPRVVSDAQWDDFLDLLAKGFPPYKAAAMAGISERSVTRFFACDPSSSGRRMLARRRWEEQRALREAGVLDDDERVSA